MSLYTLSPRGVKNNKRRITSHTNPQHPSFARKFNLVTRLLKKTMTDDSKNITAILDPTESPQVLSNASYALSIMFSSSQAQLATVSVSPISSVVTGLDRCVNQQFYLATPENFFGNTMMFVNCDTNKTETSKFMDELLSGGASCVVFYSDYASGCTFDDQSPPRYRKIPNLFTMLSTGASSQILTLLGSKNIVTATIQAEGTHTGSNNALVAVCVVMVVIAVTLFSVVMIGIVRFHRNPQRYGIPDAHALGYRPPYSSRARGLARAVLDSIPLVRVAEPSCDGSEAPQKEVEEVADTQSREEFFNTSSVLSSTSTVNKQEPIVKEQLEETELPVLHLTIPESAPLDTQVAATYVTQEEDLCPICFERFYQNEILRELPCKHRFHADCIDPWFLNESSECPLCRIDLALIQNPDQDPSEPATTAHFRGRLTQRWRKLVRSRRQQLNNHPH